MFFKKDKKRKRPASIKVTESNLQKIPAKDLQPGMYVAELDIPWEDSPFMFQGFKLKDWDDVDAVINCSRVVTVDFRQTEKINLPRNQTGNLTKAATSVIQRTATTQQEIGKATKTYNHASKLVTGMMDDIRLGKAIDTKAAKEVVSDAVDSIIRTPDAMMMLTTIKNRDEYTAEHSLNVAVLTIAFGRALNLERERLEELGVCGLLHDMGKVLTPDEVLLKEDRLSEEEYSIMKKHPTNGRDIIAGSGGNFPGAMDVAHSHHERIDGHGYPRGLYEHQMTLWSKIVSITDAFDAITSNRCYQDGRTNMEAFRIMNKARGKQFDANLVMRFIGAIGIYPPGSLVKLNTGESGVVVEANPKSSLLPKVLIVRDAANRPLEPRLIDLADKVKTPIGTEYYKITDMLKRSQTDIDVHELKEKNFLLTEI